MSTAAEMINELRSVPARRWPLADAERAVAGDPVPVGVDASGRQVTETLLGHTVLIGSVPRMGKTALAKLLAMGFALDPTVEVHVHDLRGWGWAGFEPVAYVYNGNGTGTGPDPWAAARLLRADLERVQADLGRRAHSGAHRPVLVVIDDCQVGFADPVHGDAIAALVADIARRGRSLGASVVLATRWTSSLGAFPAAVRDQVSLRACLKVMTSEATDIVLGDGSSTAGYRPHEVLTRADLGIGYWRGAGSDPVLVRFDHPDGPDEAAVLATARADRAPRC